MIGALRSLFGRGQGVFADADREASTFADPSPFPQYDSLADWLPYGAWMEVERLFLIERPGDAKNPGQKIEAVGFVLDLTPQTGADQQMTQVLTSMFVGPPEGTSIQFQMFGTPDISNFLEGYLALRDRPGPYRTMASRRAVFLKAASTRSPFPGGTWLTRDLRLIVAVALPLKSLDDRQTIERAMSYRDALTSLFRGLFMFQGEWGPKELINWCAALLNPQKLLAGESQRLNYDDGRWLRDQIIARDTRLRVTPQGLIYGSPGTPAECVTRFLSVRSYPERHSLAGMSGLIGDYLNTAQAYSCPFLITLGVRLPEYQTTKNMSALKAARAVQRAQSKMAAFMPDWQDLKQDWEIAMQSYSQGGGLVHLYHQISLFSRLEDRERDELAARGVWRSRGFDLQEDTYVQMQSLMMSLPMAYTTSLQMECKAAKRETLKTTDNVIHTAPLIGEWTGLGRQVIPLFGRRGQCMSVDLFANPAGNYNACVVGISGSGKTVFMNEMVMAHLAAGDKVWVIDVGRGYEKLCNLLGGQFLEFTPDSGIRMNPFSLVQDIDEDMEMLKPVFSQMISPNDLLPQYELAQLEQAIRGVWYLARADGRVPSVDDLATYLMTECKDDEDKCDPRVRSLGVQMYAYTSDGAHGKWFTGDANVRFDADLVVLELEELKAKKDLQSVVMSLLMYLITNDIYLNREDGRHKLVVIDEAWDVMRGASGEFIEAGYRRARKYGGAFVTGTQGVEDYYRNPAATAAIQNSDWLFMLRQKSESILALEKNQRLALTEGMRTMLASLHTQTGQYSEVFVHCPTGYGIGRLVMDPHSLLLASSRQEDFAAIKDRMRQGFDVSSAIDMLLRERQKRGHAHA